MNLRILLKIASRSRPEALLKTVVHFSEMASDDGAMCFIISLDDDDPTATHDFRAELALATRFPIQIKTGLSESKIAAVNRDIPDSDWDCVAALADDVRTTTKDFDERIREDFEKFAPDLDGVLWYPDSYQNRIPTHPVIGRKYYDRYKYIWHPAYKSIHPDDELRAVAKRQRKLFKSASVTFVHKHYRAKGRQRDAVDAKNQRGNGADVQTYAKRHREGFK